MTIMRPAVEVQKMLQKHCIRPKSGFVTEVSAHSIKGQMMEAAIGAVCDILNRDGTILRAEVASMKGTTVTFSPYGSTEGCSADSIIKPQGKELKIPVSDEYLGRVIDAFGNPIDNRPAIKEPKCFAPLRKQTPDAMHRPIIEDCFTTGIRAIDGMATLGIGQRVGVFGPPGTGKTSFLGMLASHSNAEIVVIGLVGERGREVREFVDEVLPSRFMRRSVVVAATSDRPSFERAICACTATTIAEYFRDKGKRVLLLIDSLTRTARALREIGLAAGELPTRRGYPSSVYPALPAIIERAGRTNDGDITAIYTVLTEGNMDSDPIAEEVRSLTDGHIVLSRKLAEIGHFPAIDPIASLSRTMSRIVSQKHSDAAAAVRSLLAKYQDIEMLLQVGEYSKGHDDEADRAVAANKQINSFLRQKIDRPTKFSSTISRLAEIAK